MIKRETSVLICTCNLSVTSANEKTSD